VSGNAALACYVPHLESLMVVRLLQQLASLYEVMRISELERLTRGTTFAAVEARVAEYVRNGLLEVRIDHRNGVLRFGARSLESTALRNQLRDLCARLTAAERLVVPGAAAQLSAGVAKRAEALVGGLAAEHERLLARKQQIERRKEADEYERATADAAAIEAEATATAKREADEAARLAVELAKRDKKKREEEDRDRKLRANTDWAHTVVGAEDRNLHACPTATSTRSCASWPSSARSCASASAKSSSARSTLIARVAPRRFRCCRRRGRRRRSTTSPTRARRPRPRRRCAARSTRSRSRRVIVCAGSPRTRTRC
jgi:hypothetical protein